jgi:hypothetical protein
MFGREPTLVLGFIRALVVCVAAFGFELTAEQVAGIYLLAEAFLSLVNRQKVTPVGEQ